MNNKQHKLILLIVLIGTAYGLLPVAIAKAADLFPPQMTIDQVSEQMKLKLGKDKVPKDFDGVTEVVEEII